MKFGRAVFEIYEPTDRQTDILITIHRAAPRDEVTVTSPLCHVQIYIVMSVSVCLSVCLSLYT